MPDSLDIFGVSYPSALGIKAYDINGNLLTFIKPAGTIAITSNGSVDVSTYATASVSIPGGATINNQDKSVIPSETAQSVTFDSAQGYTGLGTVSVAAISADYVGSGVARNTAGDMSNQIGPYVSVPSGYYEETTYTFPEAYAKTQPVINVNAGTGLITATVEFDEETEGFYSSMPSAQPVQLLTASASTYTPTENEQTIAGVGTFLTGTIKVGAISSNYVGSGITQRSSTDLTASGSVVTAPAGYYSAAATKTVSAGTAGTPTAAKGTVSNHQISITPSVTNTTGWITGSTKTGTAATVSASELVSGTSTISTNGTYDVTNYASAAVSIPIVTYYTGSSAPTAGLGSNNDIYLQTS